jgi:hypothetical protein
MMLGMKSDKKWNLKQLALVASVVTMVIAAPASAKADDEVQPDARLLGYDARIEMKDNSTALTYLLLVGLGVLGCGVLFINSKRTHLD